MHSSISLLRTPTLAHKPLFDCANMTDGQDVFRKVGRGGAGNFIPAKAASADKAGTHSLTHSFAKKRNLTFSGH